MLLINFSGRAIAYFCTADNRQLTAVMTNGVTGPEVLWTRTGGIYFHLFASQKRGHGHGVIRFGYYSEPPVNHQFQFGPCELALFGCGHSTGITYDAVKGTLIALQETSELRGAGVSSGAWLSARFAPRLPDVAAPTIIAIQQGAAASSAKKHESGAADSVFLIERRGQPGRTVSAFRTSLRQLVARGVRTRPVGPRKINSLLQGLAGAAQLSQNAKKVAVFLNWAGGGALEWYRSPNAKYVRAVAAAALAPLADDRRASTRRFKLDFREAKRGRR